MTSPLRPRTPRFSPYGVPLLTVWLFGCSDDRCEADKGKIESCNRVFRVDICATPEGECSVHCTARLSCDELDALDQGETPEWLSRCWAKCQERLTCDDGQQVPAFWRCDGSEDCVDGADEKRCRYFECSNGQLVREDARCDQASNCEDGTDEQGCPESCTYDYESNTEVCL